MLLNKKARIACAVVIVAAGSSIFYVKQRGEDYINQAIADLATAGVVVVEQERNDGVLDFERKYTANITDSAKLLGSFPATKRLVLSPQYREAITGNTFSIEMVYVPWTMAGEVDVLFNSPSEKLVEELAVYPVGPFVTTFLRENGLSLYSEIENGKIAQLGLRDIDYSTQENGTDIRVELHDTVATLEGKDKIVSHLGDMSFKAVQGAEQFVWSAKGVNHTMDSSRTDFDFHTLFTLEQADLTVKMQSEKNGEGNFHMSFSGVDTDTKVETRGDTFYGHETSSVANLSFQFTEGDVKSDLIIEGLNIESEIENINKTATEKFVALLQSYKEGDDAALERALVNLLQGGGRFALKDFSIAKTVINAGEMGINLETGPTRLTTDVTIAANSYDPQLAPTLALAENIIASLDFLMQTKDYEAIKALSGMGVILDGFVVQEDSESKIHAEFDGKSLRVNGQQVM